MHIGIDARLVAYQRAGIGLYTLRLIQALAAVDTEDHFTVFQSRRDGQPLLSQANVRCRLLWTPCHHPLEQWTLPLELALTRMDLLHSPDFIPPFRRRCPAVITVHDLAFLLFPHLLTPESSRYYGQVRRAVREVQGIIAVSQSTKRDLMELLEVPEERINVIYHAAEACFQPPEDPEVVRKFCAQRGLSTGYFLFVGTIEPRKNLPTLLEAYAQLSSRLSPPPLVVVGSRGWLTAEPEALANRLGVRERVIFYGAAPTEELVRLYQGALALVFPSLYEGFGFPVLEAMACGTPVLASQSSSVPEVVGDAALLIEPTDVSGWASAMERIVEDPELRERLREQGLARAQQFSWEQTACQTLRVYCRAAQT